MDGWLFSLHEKENIKRISQIRTVAIKTQKLISKANQGINIPSNFN